ncbi:NAD(P)H-binding protein [Mucilaginibacter sp. JRF]|uniref:SDR family oxidoreductase n=1 Tax=Mucilaginibacter sp. JRF TaxID=2780088 RepID=UPI0018814923|nr:NAD(P)H-binding protein [Mucilaginibacter sp. JRF]MBE9586234.1 NAD(P)H-binding protein [Mucilaginibacter sp. JRF]
MIIKKVSILGASGMVAQKTIQAFDNAGFQLKLFARSVEAKYPNQTVIKGDVFNYKDLESAIKGSEAIHITLRKLDEFGAVTRIVEVAKTNNVKLISYVSGATVIKENSWLPFIEAKYKSEQLIKASGIPYMIFRPSWFMESLPLMIQDGKPKIMGKQPLKLQWIASEDFGKLLVNGYQNSDCFNREYNVFGPEALTLNEALEKYIKVKLSDNSRITNTPFWLLKIIAFVSRNKQLNQTIPLFEFFEKTKEVGSPDTVNRFLGKPNTTLQQWLASN